jgi:acyl carrier protein
MSSLRDADIRNVLKLHGRLARDIAEVGRDDDLYAAGMTSHASVNVMLGLEEAFGIEFPDSMLNRAMFGTIRAIDDALATLGAEPQQAAR